MNRSAISILRDVQQYADPTGVGLPSWGASDMQPCPPWTSNLAGKPSQNASSPGYGRSWLGVTCAEWNGAASSTSTLLGGVSSLSLKRLGMVGNLSTALCELYPSLTDAPGTLPGLDVSQNNLVGTLPDCIGAQPPTTVASKMTFSFFDNMVRVGGSSTACAAHASH